jgi:hypothetical protein
MSLSPLNPSRVRRSRVRTHDVMGFGTWYIPYNAAPNPRDAQRR